MSRLMNSLNVLKITSFLQFDSLSATSTITPSLKDSAVCTTDRNDVLVRSERDRENIEKSPNPIVVVADAAEWRWCGDNVPRRRLPETLTEAAGQMR